MSQKNLLDRIQIPSRALQCCHISSILNASGQKSTSSSCCKSPAQWCIELLTDSNKGSCCAICKLPFGAMDEAPKPVHDVPSPLREASIQLTVIFVQPCLKCTQRQGSVPQICCQCALPWIASLEWRKKFRNDTKNEANGSDEEDEKEEDRQRVNIDAVVYNAIRDWKLPGFDFVKEIEIRDCAFQTARAGFMAQQAAQEEVFVFKQIRTELSTNFYISHQQSYVLHSKQFADEVMSVFVKCNAQNGNGENSEEDGSGEASPCPSFDAMKEMFEEGVRSVKNFTTTHQQFVQFEGRFYQKNRFRKAVKNLKIVFQDLLKKMENLLEEYVSKVCRVKEQQTRSHEEEQEKQQGTTEEHRSNAMTPLEELERGPREEPTRELDQEESTIRNQLQIPWKLTSAATCFLSDDTHKPVAHMTTTTTSTVPLMSFIDYAEYFQHRVFPGQVGAAALQEQCSCCQWVIQLGASYGQGQPRHHCLDCQSEGVAPALCLPCSYMCSALLLLTKCLLNSSTVKEKVIAASVVQQSSAFVLQSLSAHIFHCWSGVEYGIPFFLAKDTCNNLKSFGDRLYSCFQAYANRPCWGFVYLQDAHGGKEQLNLSQITKKKMHALNVLAKVSSMHLSSRFYELFHCDVDLSAVPFFNGGNRKRDIQGFSDDFCDLCEERQVELYRQLRPDTCCKPGSCDPARPWRPFGVRWATYRQVYHCIFALQCKLNTLISAAMKRRGLQSIMGRFAVGLSCVENSLWYCAEVAGILGGGAVYGCYARWPVCDILSAWSLGNVSVGIVDQHVFHRLIEFIQSGPSSEQQELFWPPQLEVILVIGWQSVDGAAVLMQSVVPCEFSVRMPSKGGEVSVKVFTLELSLFVCESQECESPLPPPRPLISQEEEEGQNAEEDPHSTILVVFTSGTSGGKPKGVRFTESSWFKEIHAEPSGRSACLSSASPAWVSDKRVAWSALFSGARCGFLDNMGDPAMLALNEMDAFHLFSPGPSESMIPFQAEQLNIHFQQAYQDFYKKLEMMKNDRKKDLGVLVTLSADHSQSGGGGASKCRATALAAVFIYEYVLGGEIAALTVGGAAVRADLLSALDNFLPCRVAETFGMTEGGGVFVDHRPMPGVFVKLIDRPDLGYTTKDQPYPRGEIAVKSEEVQHKNNWLCDEEQREEISARYTSDGFLLTRDIAVLKPGGEFFIIDRATSLKKLANGKFFSPERIEQILSTHFLHLLQEFAAEGKDTVSKTHRGNGDGAEFSSVLANIVFSCCFVDVEPDNATVYAVLRFDPQKNPTTFVPDSTEEKLRETSCWKLHMSRIHPCLDELLLREVRESCASHGVASDEIPSVLLLDAIGEPWSRDNECLTASFKVNRAGVKKHRVPAAVECVRPYSSMPEKGEQEEKITSSVVDGCCCTPNKKQQSQISSPGELSWWLLSSIVPEGVVVRPSDEQQRRSFISTTTFSALGCDSLWMSRIPGLLPRLLSRGQTSSTLSSSGACIPLLPFSLGSIMGFATHQSEERLSIPVLLHMTPLQLGQIVWKRLSRCADEDLSISGGGIQTTSLPSQHPAQDPKVETALQNNDKFMMKDFVASSTSSDSVLEMVSQVKDLPLQQDVGNQSKKITSFDFPCFFPEETESKFSDGKNSSGGSSTTDWWYFGEKNIKEFFEELESNISKQIKKLSRQLDSFALLQLRKVSRPTKSVLVTGASGYLGAAVVRTLLLASSSSSSVEKIIVFARASKNQQRKRQANSSGEPEPDKSLSAHARVRVAVLGTSLTDPKTSSLRKNFDEKVIVVDADLELPQFGLKEEQYRFLVSTTCQGLDSVIHCAGVVKSWSLRDGFDLLFPVNVQGTMRLVQLAMDVACQGASSAGSKKQSPISPFLPSFLQVSTSSVCLSHEITDNDKVGVTHFSALPETQLLRFDAYSATKLLAENLVQEIYGNVLGGNVLVSRPPLLTWDTEYCDFGNADDWLNRLISACCQVGAVPFVPEPIRWTTRFFPVNFCAEDIVENIVEMNKIAGEEEDGGGKQNTGTRHQFPKIKYPHCHIRGELNINQVMNVVLCSTNERAGRGNKKEQSLMQSVPLYAWVMGMKHISLQHPTRYHPLLDQRMEMLSVESAGLSSLSYLPQDHLAPLTEDEEEVMWKGPLRKYLARER